MTALNRHRARLDLMAALLAVTTAKLPQSWANLQNAQPGYPTGSNGPGSGGPSDRTGTLAVNAADGHPDPARAALDDLDGHLRQAWHHLAAAQRITVAWADPPPKWRQALTTEAAQTFRDSDCRLHLAVGCHTPRRPEGGDLCRWCADTKRAIGRAGDLPSWLVDKNARGQRISQTDIERARSQMRKAK